jgi:hypothetical protein
MVLPPWSEIRESLTAAIRAAPPLQLRKAAGQRIAGIGLHVDAYYGSAGLYLLPEVAALALNPRAVDNLGDWPISTDWVPADDYAQAFAAHWGKWATWFNEGLDDFDKAGWAEKFRGLLRVACEAMRQVETAGVFETIPKSKGFKVIIAEDDEPGELALERYTLYVKTGRVRCHGESALRSVAADRANRLAFRDLSSLQPARPTDPGR